MRMYDIILKKRNGNALSKEEIEFFINGYVKGEIPDYQAAALCMAVYFQGMNEEETVALTYAMAQSGDTVDLSLFQNLSVDKHSTGGVGDKTTLIVAPIVASLGGKVAKMSGRGLGHTGGTVDKLESIPHLKVTMEREDFLRQVEEIGIAVIGQSGNLTPADKKLYALRDVTATVDSIPLITSSIMSKKLAAGSHSIVLDVKVGSGAFMKNYEDAYTLAQNMVAIGKSCGRKTSALLTDMDCPLGRAIGNSLEVIEAVEILKGKEKGDLYEVCVALATEMVVLLKDCTFDEAKKTVIDAIDSGKAYNKMREWVSSQGGDASYIEDTTLFEKPIFAVPVTAQEDGWISHMNAEAIGIASVILGAGRATKDAPIDYSAGIIMEKKTGDYVRSGEALATLYTNDESSVASAKERYLSSLTFSSQKPEKRTLIYDVIR
ncbi:MAG: pyrimidine-nucleoside phosphorylase [Ruminococcus sp.]|nr:pyrimidine-nucleoside phosphorylase [Ruminococcus sp.]